MENLRENNVLTASAPAFLSLRLLRAAGPRELPGREARGRARPGRGRHGDRGPRREGAARRGAGCGGWRRARAGREFPHLDEPAEDAEEPVLAVHRAAYAVSPGHILLLVLVPGRRRRRGVTVHDLAATDLRGPRRKPPEEARGLLAPEGPALLSSQRPLLPRALLG